MTKTTKTAAEETPESKAEAQAADQRFQQAISADHVAGYLRRHPEFLGHYPELLETLKLPARFGPQRGQAGVVDLQSAMIDRLRGENARLAALQAELLATSRANMTSQGRIHAGILALLEATTFENLIQAITTDLAVLLDVDVVSLCVEAPEGHHHHDVAGVHILAPGEVDAILGNGRDVQLSSSLHVLNPVYGAGATLVRSEALLRLRPSATSPTGLLALGSRHEGRFDANQGTELLGFLARILELCIRTWLGLPRD
ncbi:MAG TPA: DUF484 family protein [Alphaproteobacteria bacterium]